MKRNDFLDGLNDHYIECRWLRHRYRRIDAAPDGSGKHRTVTFVLICTECGTRRTDTYDRNGDLLHRHYQRPQGYDKPKGVARVAMTDVRRQMIKRLGLN